MSDAKIPLQELIRPGALLADLPEDLLTSLAEQGRERTLTKGEVLFHKDDPGDYLAVVLSGSLKISTYSPAGTETVVNLLHPGDVVGELAAIDGASRSADAAALEPTELLILTRSVVSNMMQTDPVFSACIARALCEKLRIASNALESTTLDMGRRVASSLLRLAGQHGSEDEDGNFTCEISIDQGTLARYSGLTRSNLNRVLKRFERAGVSSHEKGVLSIYDTEWLEDYAISED